MFGYWTNHRRRGGKEGGLEAVVGQAAIITFSMHCLNLEANVKVPNHKPPWNNMNDRTTRVPEPLPPAPLRVRTTLVFRNTNQISTKTCDASRAGMSHADALVC